MQNLRKIRKLRGLKQKELAEIVGVTESAISQYENGKKQPSFEIALKLAEALDCESADLVTERGENKKAATSNGDGTERLAGNREELKKLVDRLTDQEVQHYLSDFRKTILGE